MSIEGERVKRLEKRVERLEALVVWYTQRGHRTQYPALSAMSILRFNIEDIKRLELRAEELMK